MQDDHDLLERLGRLRSGELARLLFVDLLDQLW